MTVDFLLFVAYSVAAIDIQYKVPRAVDHYLAENPCAVSVGRFAGGFAAFDLSIRNGGGSAVGCEITQQLTNLMAEILECDAAMLSGDTSFREHENWDSLAHL